MTTAPLTLKSFFCADPDAPIADSCEMGLARKAIDEACKSVPAPARAGLIKALAASLDEMFGVGIGSVLESSWGKLEVLKSTLEATRADPDKIAHVPLLDHKVTTTHQPHIDLMLGGKKLARLGFDIGLALDLRGVQLDIRKGRIHGLTGGECLGEGTFSLAGQTLLQRSTPALALPGRLAFRAEPA